MGDLSTFDMHNRKSPGYEPLAYEQFLITNRLLTSNEI